MPKQKPREIIEDENIDIIEPETYRGQELKFSHQLDVARAIKRVQDTGSQEMRRGWWDFKKNSMTGEITQQAYHTDVREEYIESVNNFRDILIKEIEDDPETKKKIEELQKQKQELYKSWADKEDEWFSNMPVTAKQNLYRESKVIHMKGMINSDLHFYTYYMKGMIEISRKITRTLHLLLAEIKYFQVSEGSN